MLEGLLWAVLGLIGFIVAVLAVPVDLVAQVELGDRTRLSLRIRWLFGLVRARTELGGEKRAVREKAKERKERRGGGAPSLPLIRRCFGLLGDLLGRVSIRRVALDLTVGTDDPAATGELAGFAAPIVALANALPQTSITLMPDFAGPTLEAAGEGQVRIVPITLVPPMVGFVLSPEVRRWLFVRR